MQRRQASGAAGRARVAEGAGGVGREQGGRCCPPKIACKCGHQNPSQKQPSRFNNKVLLPTSTQPAPSSTPAAPTCHHAILHRCQPRQRRALLRIKVGAPGAHQLRAARHFCVPLGGQGEVRDASVVPVLQHDARRSSGIHRAALAQLAARLRHLLQEPVHPLVGSNLVKPHQLLGGAAPNNLRHLRRKGRGRGVV